MIGWQVHTLEGMRALLRDVPLGTIPAAADLALLSPDERRRANSFRFVRDRNAFVLARAALRRALGELLDKAPEDLVFAYGEAGKPFLPQHPDLKFNLSHSGARALIAVSREGDVGVDIEEVRPDRCDVDVATDILSDSDLAGFLDCRGEGRVDAFFRMWTAKESYVKAQGVGLGIDLRAFDVGIDGAHLTAANDTGTEQWRLAPLDVGPGYAATLCLQVAA